MLWFGAVGDFIIGLCSLKHSVVQVVNDGRENTTSAKEELMGPISVQFSDHVMTIRERRIIIAFN